MNFPILSSLILLPSVGALFILLSKSKDQSNYQSSKYVALFVSFANFFISLYLWYIFDPNITDFQFVETANTRSLVIDQGTTLHNVNREGRTKAYRVETPVSVASVKGTEFSAFHDAVAGIDKFVGKSGNFDVFNTISGQTVNVGAGQKAVSNALGQLIPAPAQPDDYPEDPEGDMPDQEQPQQDQQDSPDETQNNRQEPQDQQRNNQQQTRQTQEKQPEVQKTSEPTRVQQSTTQQAANPPTPKPKKPFNLGLGVGSATIDGNIYNQVALRPELSFGKLGVGLDLVLYI